tara:strand:- start:566 stop:757 length:192 start_codon:yes stop_codon:yes gene_type:complete
LPGPSLSGNNAIFTNESAQKPLKTALSIQEMEQNAFVEAFKVTGGNVEDVAKLLGISRATCYV